MEKGRVETFADGVITIIIITIMVLKLKTPHAPTWEALRERWPVSVAYVLKFVYVGIYWNNHHHMFKAVDLVNGPVLWANLHLFFWLSLFPFTTAWLSETGFATLPNALYGIVLLTAAVAWPVLQAQLIRCSGSSGMLACTVGNNFKGRISIVVYAIGIGSAFIKPWLVARCTPRSPWAGSYLTIVSRRFT
ncbi:MAG: TMEM175 family protein [Dokdonella sp.]